ncbi:hypothetical protein [Streptomyces sp. SP18CS02]|uniref:hypothetical protein n=1 Tax=Streptomyces sp. SP18CS02 TaxID=3002531 RepID=UPI002E761156|nr:hypothetical protein [Streptomyces sp. SP18CS02]MEE1751266.1 hypothetical protein [Streptomyces sp. SP18CS02]
MSDALEECGGDLYSVIVNVAVNAWMPMAQVHCRYLGEWVGTKHRSGFAIDQTERQAFLQYAASCQDARITYDPAL